MRMPRPSRGGDGRGTGFSVAEVPGATRDPASHDVTSDEGERPLPCRADLGDEPVEEGHVTECQIDRRRWR